MMSDLYKSTSPVVLSARCERGRQRWTRGVLLIINMRRKRITVALMMIITILLIIAILSFTTTWPLWTGRAKLPITMLLNHHTHHIHHNYNECYHRHQNIMSNIIIITTRRIVRGVNLIIDWSPGQVQAGQSCCWICEQLHHRWLQDHLTFVSWWYGAMTFLYDDNADLVGHLRPVSPPLLSTLACFDAYRQIGMYSYHFWSHFNYFPKREFCCLCCGIHEDINGTNRLQQTR